MQKCGVYMQVYDYMQVLRYFSKRYSIILQNASFWRYIVVKNLEIKISISTLQYFEI